MKKWPIVAGTLAAATATLVLAVVVIVWMTGADFWSDAPAHPESVVTDYSPVLDLLSLLCTASGGALAARLARVAPVRHGTAVGCATVLVWSGADWLLTDESSWTWAAMAWVVADIPAGALGGYLAGWRQQGRRSAV